MKKLLLLSALLIFACSSDSGDGSYNECTYEPTLQANEATDITTTTAVLNGSVSIVSQYCDPYYTEQGFVYSTQPSPTLEDNSLVVQGANFSALIENLNLRTTYYTRVFLTNALGTWYGNEVEFTTGGFLEVVYGNDLINCNGNPVPRIIFGTQEWSVENACHTTYRDGTPIQPFFGMELVGAYVINPSDPTGSVLYNQLAVLGIDASLGGGVRQFAPEGWHVPTLSEWNTLSEYLISNGYNYDSTTLDNKIAESLASNSGWNPSTNEGTPGYDQSANNSSGFNAEPIGFLAVVSPEVFAFHGLGEYSYFNSSTLGFAYGIDNYQLGAQDLSNIDINIIFPSSYFPVRFIKD